MAKALYCKEGKWIRLEYFLRYPKSIRAREWLHRIVGIESDNGYWRSNGQGYAYREGAAAYLGSDALSRTRHCGPEKRVKFYLHSVISDENAESACRRR